VAGLKKCAEPLLNWKLIIIDEGEKIPSGMVDCLISCECDILPRLYMIGDTE
jgi:hypothetical protein